MIRFLITGFFSLFLFSSCTRSIPDLEGSMVGYIRSLDEFARFNDDEAGFKVVARGMGYHTAETDAAGRFEFSHLPSGTYEISIYKPGYGMMKEYSIQHLGGAPTILHLSSPAVLNKYYLYRMPVTRILDVSVANGKIIVKFGLPMFMPEEMHIQVQYSDMEDFTETDIKKVVNQTVWKNGDVYTASAYPGDFPFNQGQKIYLRASVYSWLSGGVNTYYDPELGRNVYPNLGIESDEFSFIFGQ